MSNHNQILRNTTVAIIGKGRLGSTLYGLLGRADVRVISVGRERPIPDAGIYLIAVNDSAIEQVSSEIPVGNIVIHCCGAKSFSILRPHKLCGWFHPLMTFPGLATSNPDLKDVPVAIGGDDEAVKTCLALAHALQMNAFEFSGDPALYHAAAVMAGNFSTLLFLEATKLLAKAGLDATTARKALLPLTIQSVHNASISPKTALTGPAVRKDDAIIATHKHALEQNNLPGVLEMYTLFTERIIAITEEDRTKMVPKK